MVWLISAVGVALFVSLGVTGTDPSRILEASTTSLITTFLITLSIILLMMAALKNILTSFTEPVSENGNAASGGTLPFDNSFVDESDAMEMHYFERNKREHTYNRNLFSHYLY